jgi:hypothetical protein
MPGPRYIIGGHPALLWGACGAPRSTDHEERAFTLVIAAIICPIRNVMSFDVKIEQPLRICLGISDASLPKP